MTAASLHIGIIAPAPVPEIVGGAERLWRALGDGLRSRGHVVDLVTIAFPERTFNEVLDGYEQFSALDVSQFDLVITGKYPAWMINHPRHIVYMLHPLRGLYDTYPASLGQLTDHAEGVEVATALASAADVQSVLSIARATLVSATTDPMVAYPGPLSRAVVQKLDALAFAGDRVHSFAAISEEVAGRAGYIPEDRPVFVAHPVSDLPIANLRQPESSDAGHSPSTGDAEDDASSTRNSGALGPGGTVFFTASRLDKPKRIDLIINAFRSIPERHATLEIAGDGPERSSLEQLAGTDHRIHFLGRITEDELATSYATATAVVFVPDREDFGYISLEAIRSGTPVITTSDSGGAKELLDDGVGGVVVEPTAKAIAAAMEHLADHPTERWMLGLNGQRRARHVDWSELWRLIEDAADTAQRPNVLLLSTFGIEPTIGGGQRRVRFLSRQLARHANVTVLALAGANERTSRRTLELGITQVLVPRSQAHRLAEAEITRVARLPVDDITSANLWPASPEFGAELDRQLVSCDAVIVSHPFLAPALKNKLGDLPLIYDCHNAEAQFKASVLGTGAAGDWLRRSVEDAERFATDHATSVMACTEQDVQTLRLLTPASTARFSVVKNGVDVHALPMRTDSQACAARQELLALVKAPVAASTQPMDPPIAVFVGSWHPPNIDAANVICEVAKLRPDWLFVLAGSHTISIDNGALGNVYLLPTFAEESLFPILAGADVALNPMVSGGGSNLKLYDYLAIGVPVLTTAIGARGLPDPTSVTWVCDPVASALASGLDDLFAQQAERQSRSDAGRELVATTVDWRDLGDKWTQEILDCVQTNQPSVRQERPERSAPAAPLLAPEPPPHHDPTVEIMIRVATAALSPTPPKDIATMDPTLRENLRRMAANKMAGQALPKEARLRAAKQLAVRAGKLITNEQVVFNDASVAVVEALSAQVQQLTVEVEALRLKVGRDTTADRVPTLRPDSGDQPS